MSTTDHLDVDAASTERWRLNFGSVLLWGMAFIILILTWDFVARSKAEPNLFPWPRYLIQRSLPRFASTPDFATPLNGLVRLAVEASTTLLRVMISSAIGILVGVSTGVLLFFPLRELRFVGLLLGTFRGIPLLALIPLFVLWFRDSEILSVYGYIAYAVMVIIASDSYSTACALPENLLAMARLAGGGRIKTLATFVLPAVVHALAGSLDTVMGLAWAFAVGAELIVLNQGLGHLLHTAYLQTDVGRLIILAATYAILGWASTRVGRALIGGIRI